MENFYEARNSNYCYEGTNVLKNKLEIKNTEDLLYYEAKITAAKLLQLRQKGITGDFSINHFVKIHESIFEDVYPFAGKFRNEDIAKDNFRFAKWEYIEPELKKLLEELKNEKYLVGLKRLDFSKRLAYYMSELNVLHPYREGNGRTTREFIRQLALNNGYILNLKKIEPFKTLQASIESVSNTKSLEEIIYVCLEEIEEK